MQEAGYYYRRVRSLVTGHRVTSLTLFQIAQRALEASHFRYHNLSSGLLGRTDILSTDPLSSEFGLSCTFCSINVTAARRLSSIPPKYNTVPSVQVVPQTNRPFPRKSTNLQPSSFVSQTPRRVNWIIYGRSGNRRQHKE